MTQRLMATYVTFALLILLSLEVPLGYVHHRNEVQHAFEQLEHDAEVLAAFIDTALGTADTAQIDLLAHESAQRLGGDVDIVDDDGQLLASTYPGRTAIAGDPDIRAVLAGEGRISTRLQESDGIQMMSVAVQIHPGVIAQGALRVSVPTAALNTRIEHFWLLLTGAGIIVLTAAALIAYALARWINRPVRDLEQATRQAADGTPPPPLPISTGPPELRRLAVTFAETANRLQGLIVSQRSFAAHASHQLKTPLAALRLRLENLEPDIAPAGARNLRAALTETDRLARMVETLLAIARSEQDTLPQVTVGLAGAVAERVAAWTPLAASRGISLSVPAAADLPVRSIPGALDQIIDNLLSNALRAAPADSAVRISWRSAGPATELHVVDRGPGLTTEQRDRAWEPFWRAPGAGKGGTGLGLALVRTLAEVSGGSAVLRPGEGAGIDAVVILPAV